MKQYIDLQDGRRNRTNSSAEVVKPAESLILQNKRKVKKKVGNPVEKIDFEAEEMSVKQKMQIFDNQPETEVSAVSIEPRYHMLDGGRSFFTRAD